MKTNQTTTTNKMTALETFEFFKGKSCNLSIEIDAVASLEIDDCLLEFDLNKESESDSYGVYDELRIYHHGCESTLYLGELDEVITHENITELVFDNDIVLTIGTAFDN